MVLHLEKLQDGLPATYTLSFELNRFFSETSFQNSFPVITTMKGYLQSKNLKVKQPVNYLAESLSFRVCACACER